jgi:hypothetical protein
MDGTLEIKSRPTSRKPLKCSVMHEVWEKENHTSPAYCIDAILTKMQMHGLSLLRSRRVSSLLRRAIHQVIPNISADITLPLGIAPVNIKLE